MKKIITLFTIFISISMAYAEDAGVLISKMQLLLDKNQPELVEDIFENNDSILGKDPIANERLALSYERLNKYKDAATIYRKLVLEFNSKAHQSVMDDKFNIDEIKNTRLSFYYYKLAFINAQLFKTSHKYIPIEDRKKYYGNVQAYLNLCKKLKIDENEIRAIDDLVKEKLKQENDATFKGKWYGILNIISWQDRVKLVNNSTHATTNLLSTDLGTTIGLGRKWENAKYEFNFEGMLSIANGTTSSESTNVTYQQNSVAIKAFTFGPGYYYKAFSDKVFLGVMIPFSYRIGNWSSPVGYSITDDKLKGAGYFVQLKFYVGKIAFQTRLGKIFPNPASHWSIGGIYDF